MDYKHKQLEQELSALVKLFADLGVRLSEVSKEVTSPGVMPSEKVLEQISQSRTSFENVCTAVHTHAGAMLVSPLPKLSEMLSIQSIDTLLKASAAAEEAKFVIEVEREKALSILARVLSIAHRESNEFKPLQECHAKLGELRTSIGAVQWPHRHPDSETVVNAKHPSNALLAFVENLNSLDDDKWMTLETTITETYGKPLFVAASRGKLVVAEVAEAQPAVKPAPAQPAPVASAPAPAAASPVSAVKTPPAPAPEPPKPPVAVEKPVEKAAEKPVERKAVAEKAPDKPVAVPAPPAPVAVPPAPAAAPAAAVAEKKVAPPPAPAPAPAPTPAPAAAAEKKEVAPEKPAPKPVVAGPVPITAERKESSERPHPAPAPASAPAAPPPAPAAVASAAPTPAPVSVSHLAVPAPAAAVPAPPRPPAAAPVAAASASTPAPAVVNAAPAPAAPPLPAAPAAAAPNVSHSLAALATATEPAPEKKPIAAAGPVDVADRQRKEPRLAVSSPQPIAKVEPKSEMAADDQKAVGGDPSQRPQRWGFWRGNR